MSSKNNVIVSINENEYTLSGYESVEYLQKIAAYINLKYSEIKSHTTFKSLKNNNELNILVELSIADEYFKAKRQADTMDIDRQEKSQQIYDLKHELIAAQIEAETAKKEILTLKNQLNDSKMNIVRLETKLGITSTTEEQ